MALRLLFLRKFSPSDTDYLKEGLSEYYDFVMPDDFSKEALVKLAGDADVFIGNKIFKELLDAAAKLKMIQVPGVGVDRLDLKLLRDRNISVCNSHSNAPYVAEHAVALMFSLFKKICLHDRLMRRGEWFTRKNTESDELYMSDSIAGSTVGFLGFGNIAQYIARFMTGFNVKYLAYEKRPHAHRVDPEKQLEVDFSDLKTVLSKSDVLFVTVPLTDETKDLITADEFKLMKKTAYLINVSRGAVVNQKGLYEALTKGHIAGAAIDVWYDDIYMDGDRRYPSNRYPFHKLENMILSPYRAGYTKDCSPHLIDVVKNLALFAKENKLMNIVDVKAGY